MEVDENEFFRQATLRICSSLDIEKALFSCLQYIRMFMPASKASLGMFDRDTGTLRSLLFVDHAGNNQALPPTHMSREAIEQIETGARAGDVRIIDYAEHDRVVESLRPYIDLRNHCSLVMELSVEGKRVGAFAVMAPGRGRFTSEHVYLVSLLREPFSIAMSNALRYEEVVKLKDILDAENRELSRELRRFSSSEIIGVEHGLKSTMELVGQVAPLNSPVMLLGETGVGKEVLANAIHHNSPRRGGPFVKVNCGAIPENLLDSELFGHEKGAFTGAVAQKLGRFERAHGGTIFLDEVGELAPQAQVRLLRVLQQKEIERVGGTRTIAVDVRIVAATHRDLEALVRAGGFRSDLLFRLNVFPILIPPLRERKEDIPALVDYFVGKKSKELKIHPHPFVSAQEVARLKSHHWPGNVRELENLVERALIHNRGKKNNRSLAFDHLESPGPAEASLVRHGEPRNLTPLDQLVSQHILHALSVCNGTVSGPRGAARLLGLNPNTLRGRMKKLGICSR